MKRILFVPFVLFCLSACTTSSTAPVSAPAAASAGVSSAVTGTILRVEAPSAASQQGGNAVVAVGASVLGAVIPGPWAGVAGVATNQAGRIALENYRAQNTRYVVKMSDDTVRTITQNDRLALSVGTPVEFVTLSDGTTRLVQRDISRY